MKVQKGQCFNNEAIFTYFIFNNHVTQLYARYQQEYLTQDLSEYFLKLNNAILLPIGTMLCSRYLPYFLLCLISLDKV